MPIPVLSLAIIRAAINGLRISCDPDGDNYASNFANGYNTALDEVLELLAPLGSESDEPDEPEAPVPDPISLTPPPTPMPAYTIDDPPALQQARQVVEVLRSLSVGQSIEFPGPRLSPTCLNYVWMVAREELLSTQAWVAISELDNMTWLQRVWLGMRGKLEAMDQVCSITRVS